MNTFSIAMLVPALLVSTTALAADPEPVETDAVAVAEPAEVMGGQYLQDVADGLTKQGYRSIRALGPNRLVAFDRDGSAVFLTINPDQGTIRGSEYVHAMDK